MKIFPLSNNSIFLRKKPLKVIRSSFCYLDSVSADSIPLPLRKRYFEELDYKKFGISKSPYFEVL